MDSLLALKAAVGDSGFEAVDAHNSPCALEQATMLKMQSGQTFELDAPTAFVGAEGPISLKTVVHCWLCREMSVPQYISQSDKISVPHLKFLERNDLVEWLEGGDSSEYIQMGEKYVGDVEMLASVARGMIEDHLSVLHGEKAADYGNVSTLGEQYIMNDAEGEEDEDHEMGLKYDNKSSGRANSARAGGNAGSGLPPLLPTKGKDPIILLSPSPSSLLNMNNVQSFLERGVFDPVLKSSGAPNMLRISRNSQMLGQKVRFVVVDQVDQFKMEYWGRVVAVFVTGQSWQLRQYRWKDPNTLFQNVLGFAMLYKNDPVPETLKQWNVKIEPIEPNQRFRDREVMERIWERIEEYMLQRGWPTK